MSIHVSRAGIEEDGDGWYQIRCECGAETGACPDRETAVDAFGGHCYLAGVEDTVAKASS